MTSFQFPIQIGSFHAALQLLLEQQGQETAKHMASNCLIALVVDGTGLKDRFDRVENVLDYPQVSYRREPLSLRYSRC